MFARRPGEWYRSFGALDLMAFTRFNQIMSHALVQAEKIQSKKIH
jgi:hypothetical protein